MITTLSELSASTTSSRMLRSLRASPPEKRRIAVVSLSSTFRSLSITSVLMARSNSLSRSSFSRELSTYTCIRDSSGRITSNDGFSVVAPIRVMSPRSTAPKSESCCALLKRCISSIKSMGLPLVRNNGLLRARSITSRTSLTPAETALRVLNGSSSLFATICARVVFPVPGGPHRINDDSLPESIIRRSTAPGPTK